MDWWSRGGSRRGPSARGIRRRVLWWVGLAFLLAAAAVDYGIGSEALPALLIGTVVLPPFAWAYTALGAGVCCWIAVALSQDEPYPRVGFGRLRRIVAVTVTVAALACVPPMAVLTDLGADYRYRLLAPDSPAGCRVATAMEPMLEGTAGHVYLSDPGSIVMRRVPASRSSNWRSSNWWWSNDGSYNGYDPIEAGEWSLRWDGDRGHLSITPRGSMDAGHSGILTCPHQ